MNTGQIEPANSAYISPTNYTDVGKGYDFAMTQFSTLQLFSEHFGVIVGQLNLYGDDALSEFNTGRSRTHSSNWGLSFPTPGLYVSATTLGAGVVILPNHDIIITSLLPSATDCTNDN